MTKHLKDRYRNVMHIFEHIIWPLTRMWAHPNMLKQVKKHVVIFKQDVLPSIVKWMTFGLCLLLKKVWTQFSGDMEQWVLIPQYFIKLISALEQTLNYVHTGNSKGLLYDGLPSLSQLLKTRTLGEIHIKFKVYEATFNINHSMKFIPTTFLPSHTDPTQWLRLYIVHQGLEMYEEDIRTFANVQWLKIQNILHMACLPHNLGKNQHPGCHFYMEGLDWH
ncbi:hypothetical protein BU15DRAFT_63650 [Melanogaster broomeanus]|nr:hypothetical protein BU15DRAFT_63650 [Melanogaster broomeanus]